MIIFDAFREFADWYARFRAKNLIRRIDQKKFASKEGANVVQGTAIFRATEKKDVYDVFLSEPEVILRRVSLDKIRVYYTSDRENRVEFDPHENARVVDGKRINRLQMFVAVGN